jgi:hypothetical protein
MQRPKRATAQPGDLNEDDDLPRDIAASIQVIRRVVFDISQISKAHKNVDHFATFRLAANIRISDRISG